MGFDAGITVYKRVTDEKKWVDFLRALYETYKSNSHPGVEFHCNYDGENNQFKPFGENEAIDWRAIRLSEQFNFPSRSWPFWNKYAHIPMRHTSPHSYS